MVANHHFLQKPNRASEFVLELLIAQNKQGAIFKYAEALDATIPLMSVSQVAKQTGFTTRTVNTAIKDLEINAPLSNRDISAIILFIDTSKLVQAMEQNVTIPEESKESKEYQHENEHD